MAEYLLRVEGVNLVNSIEDTDDLSTRRGGGLMVLNAARQLSSTLPKEVRERLTPIATGASIGLFKFKAVGSNQAEELADAEELAENVRTHFKSGSLEYDLPKPGDTGHLELKHGTFVVDLVRLDSSPTQSAAVQLAVAKNRWRQMQEPSVSLSGVWVDEDYEPCPLDFVRPGTVEKTPGSDPKVLVSDSVKQRRDYGRLARQKFYQDETGTTVGASFTDDLQSLAARGNLGEETAPTDTVDKIAVFYLDGNKFSLRGLDILAQGGVEAFKKWSSALQNHHRTILKLLLEYAGRNAGWTYRGDVRLETLRWGGDEIIWVVPAWKGWDLVRLFFGLPHHVTIGNQGEHITLSYGCGLVFCHVNAPIQNILNLAKKLGDCAKEVGRERNQNRLAYEVLESIDDIPYDLEEHRARWLPERANLADLVLDPAAIHSSWDALQAVASSEDFPMRQLYMVTKAWREVEDLARHEKQLFKCKARAELEACLAALNTQPVAWTHLLRILPYIPTYQGGAP